MKEIDPHQQAVCTTQKASPDIDAGFADTETACNSAGDRAVLEIGFRSAISVRL